MFLVTGDSVTHTEDHWARRSHWAGGRRQLTFHLVFDGTGMAHATAPVRHAIDGVEALDAVPPPWLHLTLTPIGFTDEVDPDAAAAVAADVFEGVAPTGSLSFDTVLLGSEGVLLPPQRADWLDALVQRQRDAVDRHLGAREWGAFHPHVSLAYANRAAPITDVAGALADPAREASGVEGRPTLAHLEQTCADHLYSWRVLRTTG